MRLKVFVLLEYFLFETSKKLECINKSSAHCYCSTNTLSSVFEHFRCIKLFILLLSVVPPYKLFLKPYREKWTSFYEVQLLVLNIGTKSQGGSDKQTLRSVSLVRGITLGFGAVCSGSDIAMMYCYQAADIWDFGWIHDPCYRREG